MKTKQIAKVKAVPAIRRSIPISEKNFGEIIEREGRRFRIELFGGQRFELILLHNTDKVNWRGLDPDTAVNYSITYCTQNNCAPTKLPTKLYSRLLENKSEMQKVLEALGIKSEMIEVLGGKEFRIPLRADGRILWSKLDPEIRIQYAVARIKKSGGTLMSLSGSLRQLLGKEGLRKVREGIGRENSKSETWSGEEFELPLEDRFAVGVIAWHRMPDEEVKRYVIARCKETGCKLTKLPSALYSRLSGNEELMKEIISELEIKTKKTETWNREEFELPLDIAERVAWKAIEREIFLRYVIARCIHEKCKPDDIPTGAYERLRNDKKGLKTVFDALGMSGETTEKWGEQEFKLPLRADGKILWSKVDPKIRVDYAIARCNQQGNGVKCLPKGLIINLSPEDREIVHFGIGRRETKIEVWNGEQFELPLTKQGKQGNIDWERMLPKEKVRYAIARCKEQKCTISMLPHRLFSGLSKEQKRVIKSELKKISESDTLEQFVDVMEKFNES